MSLSPLPAQTADKGRHYEFIKSAVNDTFKTATVSRGLALAASPLKNEAWYTNAPSAYLSKLAVANLKAWGSQNQVDHLLAKTDLYAFAEPLLKAKIKERHGIELDVKNTFLRLYLPKDKPWYAIDVSTGSVTRTVSLLDAALHNFASSETVGHGSDYISKPDERGLFDIVPIKSAMPISQFQTLCRDLDIGAQYKKHLESYLLPGEALAESVLQYKVNESQKDALAVAAHLALIKDDIQYDAYKMLLSLTEEKPQLMLNGRSMQCSDLTLLGTRLTGILLLTHTVSDNRGVRRLIVYIPHDPDHPLKEYASLKAFRDELARQFREDRLSETTRQTYRQFFSQFVDHQQRGHFFAELEQRLFVVRYHPRQDPTDQRPAWRKDPLDNPNLQFGRVKLQGDYWRHAYKQKLNKILNDAREIAVSTADTDSKARWAWWDNFKKILSDIFNVALLIATPFVPGLGELMLAYTAYQLTSDVIEGIVDLAEGLWQEAAGHVISVVTDIIQFAAFAAGAQIGKTFWVKLSSLVDGMKPVKLPNGKNSLWHPDLGPYERNELMLPPGAKPDRHGLHQYGNEHVLPLEGKLYVVEKASPEATSNTHRIKHPTRTNAYRPQIEPNGHGAWVHEVETPQDWPNDALMRRLGHSVERFSPAELEQIRIGSGTDHNALRQMHIDNSPPPPLLTDTVRRFSAYDDVLTAAADIRAGRPIDPQAVWLEPLLTGLPGWPYSKALEVFADASLSGYSRKYGNPQAAPADTLRISLNDLNAGQLPDRVANFLTDEEFNHLLGPDIPWDERVAALRNRLANAVDERRGEVSRHVYQAGERSDKADIRIVKQTFPDLPLPLAEKLVAQASPSELKRIADEKRLPLRLKVQAREMAFEACTTRAYEGFYHDELMTADSERLALNTLRLNTDTFADLRLEVRDGTYDGPLRCSVGPDDASVVRRLIRDQQGRYEVLDAGNRTLHDADDFYESILQAVPAETLPAVGYRHGQGRPLKLWIMEEAAAPAQRRTALAEPPIRPVATIETETLVRGWPWFWAEPTPEQRISTLYPKMNTREVNAFIEVLQRKSDGNAVDAIAKLESERKEFHSALQKWRDDHPAGLDDAGDPAYGASVDYMQNGGLHIEEQLIECFERKSDPFGERSLDPDQGYTLDLSSELRTYDLERWWKDLRKRPDIKVHLDKITSLRINRASLSADPEGLLGSFPHLRQLSARQCKLEEIPSSIGRMRQLEDLDLADNRIGSAPQLKELVRLRTLNLNGNPLHLPPDVGRMYRLEELSLANTDIQTWPEGLFKVGSVDRQRPRSFMLDMRQAPINTLPEVTPGTEQAFVLSRARFGLSGLTNEDRVRFGQYRESSGFAFEQRYSQAIKTELRHWQVSSDEPGGFSPSSAFSKYREETWHDLMAEPDSAGFFSVIAKQRESADYRTHHGRRQLTRRVWEMVEAAALDSELREKLFRQIVSPEDCGDLGAQLFNSLGMKVLVSKAYTAPTSAQVLDNTLVRLARSAARLDLVSDEARVEYSSQVQQNLIDPRKPAPDEVEIHLAFETGLAQRLELPWQSEGMRYQPRSGVNDAEIELAHRMIMSREQGDGLVNKMINLSSDNFWERHLRKTHPTQYERNDQLFENKLEWLDELQEVKEQWAGLKDRRQIKPLSEKLESLANQLGLSVEDMLKDEPLAPELYKAQLEKIGYQRNELSRQLTREAMRIADL
ncbi:NEL-type E3 ubiquitin ligase domain-containing protein [Pseudomonas sp. rhizo66]|uniref:dermonecrotic toxin domain-containing protein n=1 Tax=Pseudomonas sp. rhizo66 TaxID=3059674 RepID=UPI00288DC5A5|nr:DUF6543 domain-containing protein [Pseudomonas sp. rhizo66]MDT3311958.1 NEL-type E3 ubiquitin ligase domain-containing protein [Pseudomonas sp. rhizo66]